MRTYGSEGAVGGNAHGHLARKEWDGAIEIPNAGGSRTKLLLLSDGRELFFAADVAEDTTTGGYDQFRVYFHLGTIPELKNERVHLSGGGSVRALRATGLRWKGEAPKNDDERWKKYDISDWNIYRLQNGASGMHPHRQYELSIDVEEVGLSRSMAFPMRFEVETDPSKGPDGRSAGRNYLGNLGTDSHPLWFVLD